MRGLNCESCKECFDLSLELPVEPLLLRQLSGLARVRVIANYPAAGDSVALLESTPNENVSKEGEPALAMH